MTDIELGDAADSRIRTTASLLASLAARTRTLSVVSGSEAIGSMLAGLGALGREVAGTAEGARLREALVAGRAVSNGAALFDALGVTRALGTLPPSPVYNDIRNDMTLLAADDVADALDELSEDAMVAAIGAVVPPEPVDFVDVLVGLWAYARDVVEMIEYLGSTLTPEIVPPEDRVSMDGEVLR